MLRVLDDNFEKDDIAGIECKHVNYVKGFKTGYSSSPDDFHLIKEIVHLKDGRQIPRVRGIVNYERTFYVTKPGFRKHKEKKEWEDIDKLQMYRTTQANLVTAISNALDIFSPKKRLRAMANSPYLYGADIKSTALIKRQYMDKWPEARSDNRVAILDIETDVIHGTEDPIYGAITFKEKAVICASKDFVHDIPNWEEKMKEYYYDRIKNLDDKRIAERNIELECVLCDGPLQLIEQMMQRAHEWMPDILAIWNINFDIPRLINTVEKYGGNVNDIFSDPCVPKKFRNVWYKEGPSKKVTQSGKEMPLHWVDRWHTLYCSASFYVVDQAAIFAKLRAANGREPSYALDAVLKKYANTGKLKNEKADQYTGLEWHVHMQKEQKLEYGVYNLVDCISCEILDEQPKIGDLRLAFSMQCGHSDYDTFPSQPRRTVDDMHFSCLKEGKVIAATPERMRAEFDDYTVSVEQWIVTLPAHLLVESGLQNIKDIPLLRSKTYVGVYDQTGSP